MISSRIKNSKDLSQLFESIFSEYKEKVMINSLGKKFTYSEVDILSKKFSHFIKKKTNLKPGDRLAIQLPNIVQYAVAFIGAMRAGIVVVNINPLYTPYEMEKILKNSGAKAIVILENFADKLEKVFKKTELEEIFLANIGEVYGGVVGCLANFFLKKIKRAIPSYNLPKSNPFFKTIQAISITDYTDFEIRDSNLALIQYTSGSTGEPKGVMLSHANIISNATQCFDRLSSLLKIEKEIVITALPLFHIFSLTVNLLVCSMIGATNFFIINPRDTSKLVKTLISSKFSIIMGVATLFKSLVQNKNFKKVDFTKLKLVISGASPLSEQIAKNWFTITGVEIIEGYGLTEASPVVSLNPYGNKNKFGTVGLPLEKTEVKILNSEQVEQSSGLSGTLFIKGPQVMQGYWENDFETLATIKDGWLDTGDIASIDYDGYIKIIDRKKDEINISGFNVYPAEIEKIALLNKKVKEAAVVGVSDDGCKETVKIFIVKADTSLNSEEVITHCKKYLTSYKIPKIIEFRDSLPKSLLGKILKTKLKQDKIS